MFVKQGPFERRSEHIPTSPACGVCRITCDGTIRCLRMVRQIKQLFSTHFDTPAVKLQRWKLHWSHLDRSTVSG
jgi:hypothetical protein